MRRHFWKKYESLLPTGLNSKTRTFWLTFNFVYQYDFLEEFTLSSTIKHTIHYVQRLFYLDSMDWSYKK